MALSVGSGSVQFAQQVTLNPSNITAGNVSVETFTVTGVRLDTMYKVDALSLEAGVLILGARPSAKDSLEITFWNTTNADINPASQTFRVIGY